MLDMQATLNTSNCLYSKKHWSCKCMYNKLWIIEEYPVNLYASISKNTFITDVLELKSECEKVMCQA